MRLSPKTLTVHGIAVYCSVKCGRRGTITTMPIHEVPLARRSIEVQGQPGTLEVLADWNWGQQRTVALGDEEVFPKYDEVASNRVTLWAHHLEVLNGNYSAVINGTQQVDVLTETYGLGASALKRAIRRIYDRYQEILAAGDEPNVAELNELVQIASGADQVEYILPPPTMKLSIPDAEVDADLLEELKSAGISGVKAREVAVLYVGDARPTRAEVAAVFKGNDVKADLAIKVAMVCFQSKTITA